MDFAKSGLSHLEAAFGSGKKVRVGFGVSVSQVELPAPFGGSVGVEDALRHGF